MNLQKIFNASVSCSRSLSLLSLLKVKVEVMAANHLPVKAISESQIVTGVPGSFAAASSKDISRNNPSDSAFSGTCSRYQLSSHALHSVILHYVERVRRLGRIGIGDFRSSPFRFATLFAFVILIWI